jgi:type III secretion protein L
MKFFSLIYGDRVHRAPKSKIIPANEFSQLLEGKELIEKIENESLQYREDVAKECEGLKEQAELAGFNEGLLRWSEQLAYFEKELLKTKEEIEKLIVPVAINAAKKVVAREIELNPETIIDIVKQALKSVSQHHRFVIYVNKADLAILDTHRPQLKQDLENVESLVVREREDVALGDCVIETEAGIMNVQMEQVWNTLEIAFRTLL